MDKELAAFRLYLINGIGKKKREGLLRLFGTEEEIFRQSSKVINSLSFLTDTDKNYWFRQKDYGQCEKLLEEYRKRNIYFYSIYHSEYPSELLNIPDAPYGICVKGALPEPGRKRIAIVGARNCTIMGKEITEQFSQKLALAGIDVISGMARGIDHYAHTGALNGGGFTYAVMGCGVDVCYPASDRSTYNRIQQQGGIISEYPPGVQAKPQLFPMRNRIISGLSDGVLIVEAKERSGTLITADCALEQGKDVFAIPGRITDVNSRGTNHLIREGAELVTSVSDILDFYQIEEQDKSMQLDLDEEKVLQVLTLEPKHMRDIVEQSGIPFMDVMTILSKEEKLKVIRQVTKNYYIRQI